MKTSKNVMEEGKRTPVEPVTDDVESVRDDLDFKSREENIALIAYFKAQARGFQENAALDDWLAAEREFDESRSRARQSQGKVA